MTFEYPPQTKISFENQVEFDVPEDFKNDPFNYVENFGVNIKSGEKKFDDNNRLREDPTAVKILPEWNFDGESIIPVAKMVNLEKGKVGESGDPLYEYNIIKHVRSFGLPAPKPILSVERDGNYIFLTEKVAGTNWYERDSLHLDKRGWTSDEIQKLMSQAEEKMKDLSKQFENVGIIRSWKIKDMVFDIDLESKTIKSVIPTDFERTKIISK